MILSPDKELSLPSRPELIAGDFFVVARDSFLFRLIRAGEIFVSMDGVAVYGHAGIITDPDGTTFEQLKRGKHSHIDKYLGMPIMIVRPVTRLDGKPVQRLDIEASIEQTVYQFKDDIYPAWRFFWHLFKPLAKYASTGKYAVCSEVVAVYLSYIGAFYGSWKGVNPDDLAERAVTDKYYRVLFKGPKWVK